MFRNGYVEIEGELFGFDIKDNVARLIKCAPVNESKVVRRHFINKKYTGYTSMLNKTISYYLSCFDMRFDGKALEVYLNNYAVLYNQTKHKIKTLIYSFPELENSFQYLFKYSMSKEKELVVKNTSLKFNIFIDDRKFKCIIYNDIHKEFSTQKKHEVKTFLKIQSSSEITFEDIERLNLYIYRTFSFCSNRKNVKLGSVELYSKNLKTNDGLNIPNNIKLGEYYYFDKHTYQKDLKNSFYLEFDGFPKEFAKIFQACINGTIDTIYLPEVANKRDLHFFVTYVAWFEKSLKNYISNNPTLFPDYIIKENKYGASRIAKNNNTLHLQDCLKLGFDLFWRDKNYDYLIDFASLMEIKDNKENFKEQWSSRLTEIRHAITHQPIKERYDRVYGDLFILELIIYYISFRNVGINDSNASKMINNMFNTMKP